MRATLLFAALCAVLVAWQLPRAATCLARGFESVYDAGREPSAPPPQRATMARERAAGTPAPAEPGGLRAPATAPVPPPRAIGSDAERRGGEPAAAAVRRPDDLAGGPHRPQSDRRGAADDGREEATLPDPHVDDPRVEVSDAVAPR